MSQTEIEIFVNKIKAFYDKMVRIALKEGYEFYIPNLNHNELQELIYIIKIGNAWYDAE